MRPCGTNVPGGLIKGRFGYFHYSVVIVTLAEPEICNMTMELKQHRAGQNKTHIENR